MEGTPLRAASGLVQRSFGTTTPYMHPMVSRIDQNWWILRVLFGGMGIASGLDKFTNLLVDWTIYLWPFVPETLGITAATFMMIVGVIEIAVGIVIFTRFTKLGAFALSAWLLAISINLLIVGFYDIAVRDVALAIGAFVLGHLSPTAQVQARRVRPSAVV
jgi:uncharacterized membrane protein YphA (DoxX/SURF4 family)